MMFWALMIQLYWKRMERSWSCLLSMASIEYSNVLDVKSTSVQRQLLILAGDVELNPGPYDKEIFLKLLDVLKPIKARCYVFGVRLKIPVGEMKVLQSQCCDPDKFLINTLDYWFSNSPQENRLDSLCIALKSMNEMSLCTCIKKSYTNDQLKDKGIEGDTTMNESEGDNPIQRRELIVARDSSVCASSQLLTPPQSNIHPGLSGLQLNCPEPEFTPFFSLAPVPQKTSSSLDKGIKGDTTENESECDNPIQSRKLIATSASSVCASPQLLTPPQLNIDIGLSGLHFSRPEPDHTTFFSFAPMLQTSSPLADVKSTLPFEKHYMKKPEVAKLVKDSNMMANKFTRILVNLSKHIRANPGFVERVVWILEGNTRTKIFSKRTKKTDVQTINDTPKLMSVINDYCSFFNIELLETIMNEIDYEEGKQMLEVHKKDLKEYAERRRIEELPSKIGVVGEEHTTVYVLLDDSFKNCNLEYLFQLKDDLCEILKIRVDLCMVEGVSSGSIWVIFHLLLQSNNYFPLSEKQLNQLANLKYENSRVLKIKCDTYFYEIDKVMAEKIKVAVCGSAEAERFFICNGVIGEELLQENQEILQTESIIDEVNQISIEVTSIATFDDTKHDIEKYREKVQKARNTEFDLILYCLPAKTSRPNIEESKRALDELKLILHGSTWEHCVVVLTSADTIVKYGLTQRRSKTVTKQIKKEYLDAIKSWTELVTRAFKQNVTVVPAGSSQCFSILENNESWLSQLFDAIVRSTAERTGKILLKKNCHRLWSGRLIPEDLAVQKIHEHPIVVGVSSSSAMKEKATEVAAGLGAGGAAGVVGATIGATIGALAIGIPSFGVAAGTGLVLGAAIGGGIGVGTGVGITKAVAKGKGRKLEEQEQGLI